MRLVPNLAQEFDEVCADYRSKGPAAQDLLTLIFEFADKNDDVELYSDLTLAWTTFLDDHRSQMTVMPMVGMLLYNLTTYWVMGQKLYLALPALERMLLRDIVGEISEEIDRRSAENGNAVIPG